MLSETQIEILEEYIKAGQAKGISIETLQKPETFERYLEQKIEYIDKNRDAIAKQVFDMIKEEVAV